MADLLTQSPIKLDLEKDRIIKISMMQFDTRKLVFKVTRNNIPIDLSNYNIEFHVGGTNCYVVQNENKGISKKGNIVYVECISNVCMTPGEKKASLMIFYLGNIISTFNVILDVQASPLEGIKQSDNIAFTSLADLIQKLSAAESNINSLMEYTKTALNYINTLQSQIAIIQGFGDISSVKALIDSTNKQLIEHINNTDIHVTAADKANWNNYKDVLNSILNVIDNLYSSSYVIDDEGNYIVDDEGNRIIV